MTASPQYINGKKFVWGKVLHHYNINEYLIVKYEDKEGEISYHGYINNFDTCIAWETLDEALIGIIAYKYDGCNSHAGGYFCKGIGMYDKESENREYRL